VRRRVSDWNLTNFISAEKLPIGKGIHYIQFNNKGECYMKKWSRLSMSVVTLFMVLAISAMQVVPVLADDAAPPPPEATEVAPPVEESAPEAPPVEPAEVPVTVVEEVPPTAEPVVPEEQIVPVVEAQAEAPVAQPETPAEVLAQVPAGTELVVLNESGDALPLVSEEATEVFYTGDPVWCPVGVIPPSGAGCSGPKATFNGADPATSLLAWLYANPKSVAGVIWIQASYPTGGYTGDLLTEGGPIVLDGYDLWWFDNTNYMAFYDLTIKGSWTGTGTTIDPNTRTEFNVPISITNWVGNITINDIVITGATGGPTEQALEVRTAKNITLTNVDVVGNTTGESGAYLDNTDSPATIPPVGIGNIVINDSTFSGNTGSAGGLLVFSNGMITIKNLSAYDNTNDGIYLDNSAAPAAKTVTLTGSNNFSFNGGDGLLIFSRGAITLSNLNAMHNDGVGAYLDNCDLQPNGFRCYNSISSGVTLKGSANLSSNGEEGLIVYSSGAITAANLTAESNGRLIVSDGAVLYNYGAPVYKTITLTGVNSFNYNSGAGLDVNAWGGITLNNVTANFNDGTGVDLYNLTIIGQVVTLLGTNTFDGNGDNGLWVRSSGVVTLNNITANLNGFNGTPGLGNGVLVDNTQKVVFNSHNTVSNPDDDTLDPFASVGSSVLLNGVLNTFNNNAEVGLMVFSRGLITTNNVTANLNLGDGAYLDNCLEDLLTPAIECTGLAGKAITLNGSNYFNDNGESGLQVESLGTIKVNNLTANYNFGTGAYLNNSWTRSIGGVTITGFATTTQNYISGLYISSLGAVLTTNLTAEYNGPTSSALGDQFYTGVTISNATDPLKIMNVTLNGVNTFNWNWNSGLEIFSYGTVLLNNITASNNGDNGVGNAAPYGNGVLVNNALGSTLIKTVTLNGLNFFNGNLNTGLEIHSNGAIMLSKPTANDNIGNGAVLDNQQGLSAASVTILGYGVFNGNLVTGPADIGGLAIFSNGNITLNNITANDNTGGIGAYVDNVRFTSGGGTDSALPVNVTLNGTNLFNGNGWHGLEVWSDGAITLSNITANDNTGVGAYLNNTTNMKTLNLRNIILKGWGTFVNNGLNGLEFYASGSVTLSRITADGNQAAGLGTGNGVVGVAGTSITFTCGSLNLNQADGYHLTAGTFVVLKGVFTYGNADNYIDPGTPTTITRSCPLP
jgi:hypothetical protein